MARHHTFRALPLFAALAVLVGCGGGGSASGVSESKSAALRFGIEWPARARVASSEPESLVVTVTQGSRVVGRSTLNRPAAGASTRTETEFGNLAAGEAVTTVTTYAQAEGAGEALATSGTSATVGAGHTLVQTVTVAETALDVKTTGTVKGTGSLVVGIH